MSNLLLFILFVVISVPIVILSGAHVNVRLLTLLVLILFLSVISGTTSRIVGSVIVLVVVVVGVARFVVTFFENNNHDISLTLLELAFLFLFVR
jgi:hypothetical protein